jgi:hypothetical protein
LPHFDRFPLENFIFVVINLQLGTDQLSGIIVGFTQMHIRTPHKLRDVVTSNFITFEEKNTFDKSLPKNRYSRTNTSPNVARHQNLLAYKALRKEMEERKRYSFMIKKSFFSVKVFN